MSLPSVYKRPDVELELVDSTVRGFHPVRFHNPAYEQIAPDGFGSHVQVIRPKSYDRVRSSFARGELLPFSYYYEDFDISATDNFLVTDGGTTTVVAKENLWDQASGDMYDLNLKVPSGPFALAIKGQSSGFSKFYRHIAFTGAYGQGAWGRGAVYFGKHIEGGTFVEFGDFYAVEAPAAQIPAPGLGVTSYYCGSLGVDVHDWRQFIGAPHRHRDSLTGLGHPHYHFKTYAEYAAVEALGGPLGEAVAFHGWSNLADPPPPSGPRSGRIRNYTDLVYGGGYAAQEWNRGGGGFFSNDSGVQYGPAGYALDLDVGRSGYIEGTWIFSGGSGGGLADVGSDASYDYPLRHVRPMNYATKVAGGSALVGHDGAGNIVYLRSDGYRKVLANVPAVQAMRATMGGYLGGSPGLKIDMFLTGGSGTPYSYWRLTDTDPDHDRYAPIVNGKGEILPPDAQGVRTVDAEGRKVAHW